jgi:hypothetical protein
LAPTPAATHGHGGAGAAPPPPAAARAGTVPQASGGQQQAGSAAVALASFTPADHATSPTDAAAGAAAVAAALAAVAASGSFQSNDGFGDPYGDSSGSQLGIHHVLLALGAEAGQYVSAHIMELADKASAPRRAGGPGHHACALRQGWAGRQAPDGAGPAGMLVFYAGLTATHLFFMQCQVPSPAACRRGRCAWRCARCCALHGRWPQAWPTCTPATWCTATSAPTTCCCAAPRWTGRGSRQRYPGPSPPLGALVHCAHLLAGTVSGLARLTPQPNLAAGVAHRPRCRLGAPPTHVPHHAALQVGTTSTHAKHIVHA